MLFKKRLNEKQLLEQLQVGNEEAFFQLYRDNYTTVRNYIMRNNGRPEDAEDLLQEAVVVVWENIRKPGFELSSKLSTFLFAIVKRMWMKKLNKNMRISYDDAKVEAAVESYQPDFVNEKLSISQELLNQLDERCKEILTLFYFIDMDTQAIATKMGLANADVVKSKKYQCFKKLQSLFLDGYTKSDFLE